VLTFVPLLIMAFWIGPIPSPFFQILEQPVIRSYKTFMHRALVSQLMPAIQHEVAPPVATTASVIHPPAAAQSLKGKK